MWIIKLSWKLSFMISCTHWFDVLNFSCTHWFDVLNFSCTHWFDVLNFNNNMFAVVKALA